MTGRCLGNDPMRCESVWMVATEIPCCALQCRTEQGSRHEHPLGRNGGPIAGGICNAAQEDCMLCDAVGELWLATARCWWQLGGEVDHTEPCWTLSLRCHRYDGDLCRSLQLQEGGWVERWMRCQNGRWLGLWRAMVTPATRMQPWPSCQPGEHAGARARGRHKTDRPASDRLLVHDVTFSCHLRDVMAMGRDVPGLNRATSGAGPRGTELT